MERTIHPGALKNKLDNGFLLDVRRSNDLTESNEQYVGTGHDRL